MNYISTRGEAPAVGFADVLLTGLAPDGGLYLPQHWPELSPEEIARFAGRPYAEVAADMVDRFAGGEIAPKAVAAMCEEAYAGFRHKAVVPAYPARIPAPGSLNSSTARPSPSKTSPCSFCRG